MPLRYLRRIGWAALLAIVGVLLFAQSLQVNAVKSEVRRTEMRILALKHEKMYLETEFETRSNQQQLESWNDVEFGYLAPGPGQYFEGERALASLGKPAGPDAPEPIRYAAVAGTPPAGAPPASPAAGAPRRAEAMSSAPAKPVDREEAVANLGQRLVRVEQIPSAVRVAQQQVRKDNP